MLPIAFLPPGGLDARELGLLPLVRAAARRTGSVAVKASMEPLRIRMDFLLSTHLSSRGHMQA
jgi:hypothetical protein